MRRKSKSTGGNSGATYWLLTALLLAAVAWVVWQKTHVTPASPSPKSASLPKPVTPVEIPPLPAIPIHQITNLATNSTPLPVPIVPAPPVTPLPPETGANDGLNLRPVRNPLEAQIAMARQAICSGSIDGAVGSQTRAALRAWQRQQRLPVTGELDAATKNRLSVEPPITSTYILTSSDLLRLQPVAATWLGKSQQSALDYQTILELVAEQHHAHPALIQQLNPGLIWTNLSAGTPVVVPRVEYPPPRKAAWLRIALSDKRLSVFDAQTNLLAYFPVSIGARMEKRPVGRLSVTVVAPNPNYTFDPEVFPESAEGRELGRKLLLPPGPNNPVGVAWIGLDRPGYGIHGTPVPENVGRTESHGCFRLANWNAEYLARMVFVGLPVLVTP